MTAISRYDRPYEIVREQIDVMSDRADEALTKAHLAIDELKKINADLDSLPPTPSAPINSGGLPSFTLPQAPTGTQFGAVSPINIPDLTVDVDQGDISIDAPPVFTPSVLSVTIPHAPGAIDTSGLPDRPVIAGVDIPDAPNTVMPSMGDLAPITVPVFAFPALPVFDAMAPEFEGTAPNTVINWSEPSYSSETLTDVKGRIRSMLAGGTGLPASVEQALFDRARVREDQASFKAKDDATQAFAARGFELAPGALAKQIHAVIEANSLRASDLAREILIKSAEWEIENLRNAVAQGIALESMLLGSFNEAASRGFELAKLRLQADMDMYNASVALFNARQSAYQTEATVYRTRLEGALSEIEVFKAQIEGEKAKGELNEQTVRVYTAKLQGVASEVEIYKSRMSGAQIKADLDKSRIDMYRADIQAYAEKIAARKVEFDAYETSVKAEQAKIGILEAEARAFAATVQGYESSNNVKIQAVRMKVDVMNAQVAKFGAQLQGEQARIQAELASIQALTSAYQADVSRYSAELGAETSKMQLEQARMEGDLRNNLAFYEIELKKYDASIQRLIQQVQIQSEAIKAAGTMSAQLAAGAMAATNVSASMSGSANISSSDSISKSNSYSESHSYSYES